MLVEYLSTAIWPVTEASCRPQSSAPVYATTPEPDLFVSAKGPRSSTRSSGTKLPPPAGDRRRSWSRRSRDPQDPRFPKFFRSAHLGSLAPGRARTSEPCYPGCPPTWATSLLATRTRSSRLPLSFWRSPSLGWERPTGHGREPARPHHRPRNHASLSDHHRALCCSHAFG
jgi:hypothetical protein